MAGNVMQLHRFADDVGPLPLVLLDQNYDALTLAVNTLNTYSNFYTDLGTTNAVTLQTPGTQTVAYGDGLVVMTRVAATNTGPTTLNVNNLGALPVLNPDGSQFTGGELSAGTVYSFVFNAGRNAWQIGGGGGGGSQITAPFTVVNADGHPQLELRTDGYSGITAWPSGTALNLEANGGGALGTPPSQLMWDSSGNWIFGGTSSITVPSLNTGSATIGNLSAATGALGTAPNQLTWDAAGNFTLTGAANLPAGSFAKLTDVDLANPVMGDDGVLPADLRMVVQRGTTTPPTYTLSAVVGAPFEVAGPDGAHLRVNPDGSGWVGPHTNTGGMLAWDANGNFSFDPPVSFPLDILTNVHISGPAAGQVLTYSVNPVPGWVNATIPGFSFLNSLSLAGATTGQVMTFDGNAWVPANPGEVSIIPLTSLSDVSITTPLNRQVLTWDAPNSKWVNAPAATPSLATLPDVQLVSQIQGQALTWNASTARWVNTTIVQALAGLSDVAVSGQTQGQALTWNAGTSRWVNTTSLSNVAVSSPANGQVLAWNGTNWVNTPLPGGAGIDTLAGLTDVSIIPNPPPNGSLLTYRTLSNRWEANGPAGINGMLSLVGGTPNQMRISLNPAGNAGLTVPGECVSFQPPTNTTGLVIKGAGNSVANVWSAQLLADYTASYSNGLLIKAGTNANDSAILIRNAVDDTTWFQVKGDGSGFLGLSSTANLSWNTPYGFVVDTTTAATQFGLLVRGGTFSTLTVEAGSNVGTNALSVAAGSTATDTVIVATDRTGGNVYFRLYGDGSGKMGPDPHAMNWGAAGGFSINQPLVGTTALTVLGRFNPTSVAAFQATGGSNNPGLYVNMTDNPSKVSLIASGTNIPGSFALAFANGEVLNFGGGTTATFSAQYVQVPNMAATGVTGLPYIVMDGNGNLLKWGASSSLRYKTNIHSVVREQARAVLSKLRAITYTSTIEGDDPERVSYGLIAEEVAKADSRLVYYKEGKPESVIYERVAMLLIPLLQELLGMDEPEGEVYG